MVHSGPVLERWLLSLQPRGTWVSAPGLVLCSDSDVFPQQGRAIVPLGAWTRRLLCLPPLMSWKAPSVAKPVFPFSVMGSCFLLGSLHPASPTLVLAPYFLCYFFFFPS